MPSPQHNARPLFAAGRWLQVRCSLCERLILEDGLWLELVSGTAKSEDQVEDWAKDDEANSESNAFPKCFRKINEHNNECHNIYQWN